VKNIFLLITLASIAITSFAEDRFFKFKLASRNAELPIFEMSNPNAVATLILLPGGDSGTGGLEKGKPQSKNFLSRSRDIFYNNGFNILVTYRATDLNTLDYSYRISNAHIEELKETILYAKKTFNKPVWLIGTSRGSVSGTAATINLGSTYVNGLVLTSSITNSKPGAISSQNIEKITIPVLVVHNAKDSCKICSPEQAAQIINLLSSSQRKQYIEIDGGYSPTGDPCQALHWHGFVNYETETVKIISDWIKQSIKL
jgi:pimeloyl-ACP methyl ester carboxylesterase